MSGFVKQMMALAQKWLTENPTPRQIRDHVARAKDVIARARVANTPDVDKAEADLARMITHVELGHMLVPWAVQGYNVFDLSPDFVAAMLLTDPSSIDTATLRLPFQSLLILLPDRFAIGANGASYTKVFVAELPSPDPALQS